MKLYMVTFDGETDYVEASDLKAAIDTWRQWMKSQFEDNEDREPEAILLVHGDPVIRADPVVRTWTTKAAG